MKNTHVWACVCGKAVVTLTDNTRCKCNDYYDQEWRRVKKSCRNCAILKELHLIGRDCNFRMDNAATVCNKWVYGKCRNNLNVRVE
jgi:hypothetical protein